MCQRRQNSVMDADLYGMSKFFAKTKPSINPRPIAISEYALKSK
ncbi:MAG: hypothetical protein BWY76_02302 [bacterium ADurb.Bin429]|nr:MAG: hypothetical protein BWY76_02302 [bacterium ADurb.Bin429]